MRALAVVVLCCSRLALAEEPAPPTEAPIPAPQPELPVVVRPPPPPAPAPMPPTGGPPRRGFLFGGELGVTAGSLEDGDTTDSFSLVTLMPMVYRDLWESRDARARLNVVGGIGVGKGKLTSESAGTTTESTAEIVPLLLGFGGDYYMHKNFALGVEVSLYLPVLGKVEDGGMDVGVKGGTQSIHGLLRFTFVTGD